MASPIKPPKPFRTINVCRYIQNSLSPPPPSIDITHQMPIKCMFMVKNIVKFLPTALICGHQTINHNPRTQTVKTFLICMLVKPDPHLFGMKKVDSGKEIKAPPPQNTLIPTSTMCNKRDRWVTQPVLFTQYL